MGSACSANGADDKCLHSSVRGENETLKEERIRKMYTWVGR